MKFNLKKHKTLKTKNYLKGNNLFLFFSGINQDSSNWLKTEQNLKNINLNYYKIFNRTSNQIFKNSIYKNIEPTINGITFFIKPASNNIILSKKTILNIDKFDFLAAKLNNKMYSTVQLNYTHSLNYSTSELALYQFSITNLKTYFNK